MSSDDTHTQILRACTGEDLLQNNRINDLPDDILVHILSLLTLKEAGRTSVISKRWRHVWAYVPSLEFDASDVRKMLSKRTPVERREEECKYFCWVDQVVRSHKAHTIDEFSIRYNLRSNRKDDIDNWLRFAMEKRVKRLELDIQPNRLQRGIPYTFPDSLSSWNRLTSLQLKCVEVSGAFLEKVLCDCQNLAVVSIMYAKRSLGDLKIDGHLNLKHLTFYFCHVEHLKISAPNLISFNYTGPNVLSSPFKSTPKLAEVTISGDYANHLLGDFSDLSSCMSHIEELTLCTLNPLEGIAEMFPVGSRLKMLFIQVALRSNETLFHLSSMIKACPLLHKLGIKIFTCETHRDRMMTRKRIRSMSFLHNHLKILEIIGFGGSELEMRFAKYLIRCAVLLEKVIIQTDCLYERGEETPIRGREQAKLLFAVLKPGTELVVHGTQVGTRDDQYSWSITKDKHCV